MSEARRKRRLLAKKDAKHSLRLLQTALLQRPCGDCTACCTVMGVSELEKPPDVRCEHACDKGCGIYAQRPQSCKDFNCLWRYGLFAGHGPDLDQRPDKLGLVFDITGANSFGIQMLVARQVWPGAFEQAESVLARLVAEGHVIILIDNETDRRLIGPPEKVDYIRRSFTIEAQ